MLRTERLHYCRRHGEATLGDAQPFALPGARAVFAPDRICDVRHIKIEVSVDFEKAHVDGICTQWLTVLNDGPCRLSLNAVEMTLHAVTLSGGHTPVFEYEKGAWGPMEAEQRIPPPGGWHNPSTADQEDFRVTAQTS